MKYYVDLFFMIALKFLCQLLSQRKSRVRDVIDRCFVVSAVLDVLHKLCC